MKRLSNFLVEKHKAVLILFICFTLVCAWLMTQMTINSDMTKYLPETSPMKAGIAVIDAEFPAQSSFNLMVKGLPEGEKSAVRDYIAGLDNVFGVAHDDSAKYNVDDKTLYVIQVNAAAASPEVKAISTAIKNRYSNYPLTLSGDALGNTAMELLPMLAAMAFAILMVILFVMCNSWVEPLLFLCTIGIAIIINMGTNAAFESVSDITAAIAAILQLVLSMDYSIMLLNRYRQEKALGGSNNDAMKRALQNAFASISSSSVTTIVGMLALVFMSFTIGRDIGFVLAKGVLLSLICIFTALPGLILIFDRAIEKTAKKSLHIKMDKIGAFSYWARRVIPIAFIVLFAVSFYLQGNVEISYTMGEYYEINNTFPLDNTLVLVYENRDEAAVGAIAAELESDPGLDTVSAYSTTLGKEMGYREMAETADMEETFAAQLYGYYFDKLGELPERKLTLAEFIRFIQDDVVTNEQFAPFFTEENLKQLDAVGAMASGEASLTAEDFAALSGMNTVLVQQLYGYYFTQYGETEDGSIPLTSLVAFLSETIAANPQYAAFFPEGAMEQLAVLGGDSTDAETPEQATEEMTAAELAAAIGMDEAMVKQLFYYYAAAQGEAPQGKIAMADFMRFILTDVANDEQFKPFFTEDALAQLQTAGAELDDGIAQLVGKEHSRAILTLNLPEESPETFALIASLETKLDAALAGEYSLVGNSSMAYEMNGSFPGEMNLITILTAVAIFLVVAVAFRSVAVPLILVCVIQCAIFITMASLYIQGSSIYYLPLLIVQCLLMGATVDYGILYTSYYREARETMEVKPAVTAALNSSIHTILTSSLILITVTFVLGLVYARSEPSISEILLIIARGGVSSTALVVFVLPGLMAALDRFVVGKKKKPKGPEITDSQD